MTPHKPEDDWSSCDDTLQDGRARAPVTPGEKRWLMEQRFVHGMLRSLQGADSESREARVHAILEAIPRRAARRRFLAGTGWATAAAALVVTSLWAFGAFETPPQQVLALPTPEHVLQLAIRELAAPVDHVYDLDLTFSLGQRHSDGFKVYVRGGGYFLLDGDVPTSASSSQAHAYVVRCDGKVVSVEYPGRTGAERLGKVEPLSEARKTHDFPRGLFGAEHLDFVAFLGDLPNAYDLTTVERIAGKSTTDEPLVRIRALRREEHKQREEREVTALIGERSGLVLMLQIVIEGRSRSGGPSSGFPPFPRGKRGESPTSSESLNPEQQQRQHEQRERAELGDRAKPERGGRRGGSPAFRDCGDHTLTFRYSDTVQLPLSEYAPPK